MLINQSSVKKYVHSSGKRLEKAALFALDRAVVDHRDIAYDANHLAIVREQETGKYLLSFICSGLLTTLPADQVKSIRYQADGATWCGVCDAPLSASPIA